MKPIIVTLTGPSCAGKTTLERMLQARGYEPVVSTTTRSPRHGELDGTAYHFITEERFAQMAENNELVESVEFNGCHYGLSRAEVERVAKRGSPVVMVVEPQGHKQVKRYCQENGWAMLSVWVGNPREVILRRFMKRFAILLECSKNRTGLIERESQRLNTMFEVEAAWVAEAFMDQSKRAIYDLQLAEFGPDTELPAITMIQSTVVSIKKDLQKAA